MGRVARYKRIKAFDPGAKRRPAPPERGPPKNLAPKRDPDVIPQKLAEMMRMQAMVRASSAAQVPVPHKAVAESRPEEPHEFYKVRCYFPLFEVLRCAYTSLYLRPPTLAYVRSL